MAHAKINCDTITVHITDTTVICTDNTLPNFSSILFPNLNGNCRISSAKTYMTDDQLRSEFAYIQKQFS